MDARRKLLEKFGQARAERCLGIIGILAVTVAIVVGVMDLSQRAFITAWSAAAAAIILWNVLVLVRQRREGSPRRAQTW